MRELKSQQPGYFEIFEGALGSGWYFHCKCPCGCQYDDIILLHKAGDPPITIHTFWEWNGNFEKPTISPSFKRHTPCGIHFNVTAGAYMRHNDPGTSELAANVYHG